MSSHDDIDDGGGGRGQSYATTSYHSFSETMPSSRRSTSRDSGDATQSIAAAADPLAPPPVVIGDYADRGGGGAEAPPPPRAADDDDGAAPLLYRGFATSIADLFADARHERVDCCAITCGGLLQHDRDRYLLSGVPPPSFLKRFVMHLCVPASLFLAAGMGAMRIRDAYLNEVISTGLLCLLAVYFFMQCAKGRAKRLEIRKQLLYTKHQVQQQHLLAASGSSREQQYQAMAVLLEHDRPRDSGGGERDYYLGQTRGDMRSAHPCCLIGCYAEDRPKHNDAQVLLPPRRDDNLCACLFEFLCPPFCGGYVQLCGMCALAQEARDIESCVLPAPYRRIDYITMEAVLKYYPAIYHRRHHRGSNHDDGDGGDNERVNPEPPNPQRSGGTFLKQPLSRLSCRLLQSLLLFWMFMGAWSYAGSYYWTKMVGQRSSKQHGFGYPDLILLVLTFGQAFVLLSTWTYFVNRPRASELSMDAIIKFFASGFFLSASLALFWEMAAAAVVNTFVTLLLAVFGVDIIGDPQSNLAWLFPYAEGSYVTTISGSPTLLARFYRNVVENTTDSVSRPDYAATFGMDHPVLYTLYILLATFFVAGFIEELCKYFGFRMVEHPDFFTRDELEEATAILHRRHEDDEDAEDEESADPVRPDTPRMNFSKQCQSVQARGAAITLAMVSVAIGFACCENLIYIFFYAGHSFELELGVLIERSFFPVHPILAAIQSIGVCRRELEASRATKLGRIILPAVIFHGTFDFLIIFIAFVGKLVGQGVDDGDLRISNTAEFLSVVSCVVVMFVSLLYLHNESGKQRARLAAIDLQTTVDRSSLI